MNPDTESIGPIQCLQVHIKPLTLFQVLDVVWSTSVHNFNLNLNRSLHEQTWLFSIISVIFCKQLNSSINIILASEKYKYITWRFLRNKHKI